jgi:hypothetical protein
VQVRNPDEVALARRATAERTTVRLS